MAERRMFTKKITESDAFLDMPMSTQCLYFHLNMAADDDGFVNNPKKIVRSINASEDDFKLLIAKAFIIVFESGVIVIKHWKMHNYIQSDRYKPTDYVEEKALLGIKADKAYTLDSQKAVYGLDTECIQNVSVGKDRLGKDRLGKDKNNSGVKKFTPPSLEEVQAYITEKNYTGFTAEEWINFYEAKNWYIGKNKMVNWKSAVNTWGLKERRKATEKPKTTNKFNQIAQNDYDFDAISKLMEG